MNGPTKSETSDKIIFLEGCTEDDIEKEYQAMVEHAILEDCRIILPKGFLSITQVNMFLRCGIQYKARYPLKMKRKPTAPMVEGKSLHRGLEIGHREAIKSSNVPLSVMLDAHNDSWKAQKADIDWQLENEDESDNEELILKRGRTFLSMYHQDYLHKLRAVVDSSGPYVERKFIIPVGEQRIPVLGYVDLLAEPQSLGEVVGQEGIKEMLVAEGASGESLRERLLRLTMSLESQKSSTPPPLTSLIYPTLVDQKVVGRAKSQNDVHEDLQLTVYSYAVKTPNVRFNSFTKTKTPVIKTVSDVRTKSDWEWAEFVIQQVAKAIAAGIFLPSAPGWHCSPKWCGYYDECRHGNLRKD